MLYAILLHIILYNNANHCHGPVDHLGSSKWMAKQLLIPEFPEFLYLGHADLFAKDGVYVDLSQPHPANLQRVQIIAGAQIHPANLSQEEAVAWFGWFVCLGLSGH